MEFPSYASCELCPLHQGCSSPGLPTRLSDFGAPLPSSRAVLVVGEAPGFNEDSQGRSWVGASGQLLHRLLAAASIPDMAHVYLSNACRCAPPQNRTPTGGQVKRCRAHLEADLALLRSAYAEVVVLACGSKATLALGFRRLGDALRCQGWERPIFGVPTRVFATNHPAILLPGRKPSLIDAVAAHLSVLNRYLSGSAPDLGTAVTPTEAPSPPTPFPSLLCLDIETYGALAGFDQSVFHPAQSEKIDGIPRGEQIVVVGLAWQQPDGTVASGIFRWRDRRHRTILADWLIALQSVGGTLLTKHGLFDLMYLRYNDPVFAYLLSPLRSPETGWALDDLEIVNHLDYELRPEKSLKSLAELFGVGTYARLGVNIGQGAKASGDRDRTLWEYCATDCVCTLRLYTLMFQSIVTRYGPNSSKCSDLCRSIRSRLLWSGLFMSEAGIHMDEGRLRTIQSEHQARMDALMSRSLQEFGFPLAGPGSEKPVRQAVIAALSPELLNDPRVELTDVTRDISTGKNNIALALETLAPTDPRRAPIQALRDFRETAYVVQHYTSKLLTKPRRGLSGGFAYPSWHLVPSGHTKDAADSSKGTIQGRITCTNPPAQTFPEVVAGCINSRFPGGVVLSADESQIELRTAGLLSGDPVFLENYLRGRDLHSDMAHLLFPSVSEDHPLWASVFRDIGKRANFLTVYGGGVAKLEETIRKFLGHAGSARELTEPGLAARGIALLHERHKVYYAWVQANIEWAGKHGYLELLSGWGRTFAGGLPSVQGTYANEIANFPTQTIAAQLVLDAQFEIQERLLKERAQTRIIMNGYDALVFDCPSDEVDEVRKWIDGPLTRPRLLDILSEALGRTVPLQYTVKVLSA